MLYESTGEFHNINFDGNLEQSNSLRTGQRTVSHDKPPVNPSTDNRPELPSDLAPIVAAWPSIPDQIKNAIDAAKVDLARRRIDIIDAPDLAVADIAAMCYARRGVKLVVVDYLQILGKVRGSESTRESLVESIKALKVLAKRLGATVVAGSQLSREGDEKPSARHLAESDEILRSADAVLVMDWADDNPPPESPYSRSPVTVNFSLTHRHGPSAKFPMAFYRSQRRFGEMV